MGERGHLLCALQPAQGQPAACTRHTWSSRSRRGRLRRCCSSASRPRRCRRAGSSTSPPTAPRGCGLARLPGQVRMLLPLRPGAGVEPSLAAGQVEPVKDDARGDTRAAVGDELARREAPGSGSCQGALSAPGMRPGTRSIGFGSPRNRVGRRASTTTSSPSRAASSSSSIVSSVRGRGSKTAGSACSSPGGERARARRRGRSRRRRRGRSGAGATRAARRRRASRRRRRTCPGRSRRHRRAGEVVGGRERMAPAGARAAPRGRGRRRGKTAPGMWPSRYCARPQPGSSSAQRQSAKT